MGDDKQDAETVPPACPASHISVSVAPCRQQQGQAGSPRLRYMMLGFLCFFVSVTLVTHSMVHRYNPLLDTKTKK